MDMKNKKTREPHSAITVNFKAASRKEVASMERALDGLLAELVRQQLTLRRISHDSKEHE